MLPFKNDDAFNLARRMAQEESKLACIPSGAAYELRPKSFNARNDGQTQRIAFARGKC